MLKNGNNEQVTAVSRLFAIYHFYHKAMALVFLCAHVHHSQTLEAVLIFIAGCKCANEAMPRNGASAEEHSQGQTRRGEKAWYSGTGTYDLGSPSMRCIKRDGKVMICYHMFGDLPSAAEV